MTKGTMRKVILRSTRFSSSALIAWAPRLICLAFDFHAIRRVEAHPATAAAGTQLAAVYTKKRYNLRSGENDGSAPVAMFRGGGRRTALRQSGAAARDAAFGARALHQAA